MTKNYIIVSILVVLLLMYIAPLVPIEDSKQYTEKFYVQLLCGIPIIIFFGIFLVITTREGADLSTEYINCTWLPLGTYFIFSLMLFFSEYLSSFPSVFSIFSLLISVIILFSIMGISFHVLDRNKSEGNVWYDFFWSKKIHPFPGIMLLFVYFLCITYLLSLSLFLDNKLKIDGYKGLYKHDYNIKNSNLKADYKVYFKTGKPKINSDDDSKTFFKNAQNNQDPDETGFNFSAFIGVIDAYSKANRLRIILKGFTSLEDSEESKAMGWIYAHERIFTLQQRIEDEFVKKFNEENNARLLKNWSQIEWVLIPRAEHCLGKGLDRPKCQKAEIYIDKLRDMQTTDLQLKNGVESKSAPVTMLDTIYFTAYTITTTGYGDIIPISAFAKTVTVIANFYELLFTVMLLNVILAGMISEKKES